MRPLYFCKEYYCDHGGRTHAKEFFSAFSSLPEVTYAKVFPSRVSSGERIAGLATRGKLSFLPTGWQSFLQFFKPRIDLTNKLIAEIDRGNFDTLIIRTGTNLILSRIKRAFPRLVICLEINSFKFDEHFQKIWFRSLWQSLEVRCLRQVHCFVVVSSLLKTYLVNRGIDESKILVNPNGVNFSIFRGRDTFDRERLRLAHKIPRGAFLLGYVGGMEPFRRLPEVIEQVAGLRRNGEEDIFLMIIGDGKDMPQVVEAIEKNRDVLDGWVSCLGWQPYERISEYIAMFDLAIFPFTNHYCSPLKLFEYLAMGMPTVGPDIPSVREVFEDGQHLFLVSQDGQDFCDIIIKLKNYPEIREKVARKGRQLVLNSFTWDHNARRVLSHIHQARLSLNE